MEDEGTKLEEYQQQLEQVVLHFDEELNDRVGMTESRMAKKRIENKLAEAQELLLTVASQQRRGLVSKSLGMERKGFARLKKSGQRPSRQE